MIEATDPRARLSEFAGYLREHGFLVGPSEVDLMIRAASLCSLARWRQIRSLWRSISCGSAKQWQKYPELHQAFWFPGRVRGSTRSSGVTRRARTLPELVDQLHRPPGGGGAGAVTASVSAGDGAAEKAQRAQGGASRTEPLARRDFADWTPEDVDRFEPIVVALQRRLRSQLLRRWDKSSNHAALHLRRSFRTALSTGGELLYLQYVRRRRRLPRINLLVDVSRSMEAHAHFFLRLARAFVEIAQARAFVFHTRVSEITALLKRRSWRVQEKINAVTFGFGGGTRIASSLATAVDQHLRRELRRGDYVMIFSDGFDTDAPGDLAKVLADIRARGARIFWLHPTREPPRSTALGMARGQVSRFIAVYDLASLARLPQQIVP